MKSAYKQVIILSYYIMYYFKARLNNFHMRTLKKLEEIFIIKVFICLYIHMYICLLHTSQIFNLLPYLLARFPFLE